MAEVNKAQSWDNCDDDIRQFVLGFVEMLKAELKDNLVGIYLHGSLAMGSYYRPKSDIDLIVVVQEKLGMDTAKTVGIAIAQEAEKRPTTGNVELSIITADVSQKVPVPTPFELHYSTEWHDKTLKGEIGYDSSKTDIDLLSHLMYVRQPGVCLYGQPIAELFGEYEWQHFMNAAIDDFDWIVEGENIVTSPFYGVLNICRVLQLLNEKNNQVHSKDEGGEWALTNLPAEYHALIQKALDIYRSSDDVTETQRRTGGQAWDKTELLAFRNYARQANGPKESTTMNSNDPQVVTQEKRTVQELTGAALDDIRLNDTGWTSRVYVVNDGEFVVKFPRMEEVKKEYIQEIKAYRLLERLDMPMQAPKLRWTHPNNDYFGYQGIVGTQFGSAVRELDSSKKRAAGEDIGTFLKQLHKQELSEPHSMTVEGEINQAQEKFASCSEILPKYFNAEEIAALEEFINQTMPAIICSLGDDTALCHGDLGYWNLLLKADGTLGVIDFGDVGYYDRSKDFCGLQDAEILDAALAVYGDTELLRQKITIRQQFLPFFDLQYFTASKDEVLIQDTITKVRSFLLK